EFLGELFLGEPHRLAPRLDLVADVHRHLPVVKERPANTPGALSNLLYIICGKACRALQKLFCTGFTCMIVAAMA
ncbi:hypothetical protein, partial [Collinsella aerofaciens]